MEQINRRTWMQRAALAAAGHALAPGMAAAFSLPEAEANAIAGIARETMALGGIPGLSIAIARGGQLVHRAAFGIADREAGAPVTTEHLFRIASVSKPITSAAIWALIEEGKLRPDDRVFGSGGVLPAFKSPAGAGKITIHHLLTHTGGGWGNQRDDPMFMKPAMNHRELIEWTLSELPLQSEPGTKYAYSNFGYCVLGRVIETVTRQTYADYVQDRLLAGCGITSMRISGNGVAGRLPLEVCYYGQANENPYRPTMNVTRMDAHGGWLATAEDLVRFLIHVDGMGGMPDLLRPDSIRAMTTGTRANPGYACGWSINSRPNWWHMGSLPGTSSLAVRTAGGLCWAALANTRLRAPQGGTGTLLDRMMWKMVRAVPAWQA